MSRDIIDRADGHPFSVNTYWSGEEEAVQITFNSPPSFIQMSRKQAIDIFKKIISKLKKQIKEDKKSPPWWQEIHTR